MLYRLRDTQRRKMYNWEFGMRREFDAVEHGDFKLVMRYACEMFETNVPSLEFNNRKKAFAHYSPRDHNVVLPGAMDSWAHNLMVVLHETAHSIVHQMFENRDNSTINYRPVAAHGGEFMFVLITLMAEFSENENHNFHALKRSANKAGVYVAGPSSMLK